MQTKPIDLVLVMVAEKRTKRVVSTDIHEEINPQTQDTLVVETTTTTTTTTTKKRIYVKDSNIDLTNIQSLLDDKTDTYALSAIANAASDHSCQFTSGSNKERKDHFENSSNASHSPLSSTKVSNEIQSDEENDPLITVDKKNKHPAPKTSVNSTKNSNHKVNSPNLSCISCNENKASSNAKRSTDLNKKTETKLSKNMPKTPKNFKEKRIEDLISQYISVGPVEQHKAKVQNRSNNIPTANTDNHNLSDIAEASFEASDSAGDLVDGCGSELAENDDLSSVIVQNASQIKHGNEEIEANIDKIVVNTKKNSKQTPTTKSQTGKRGKSTKKLKSQSESTENDKLESGKANEPMQSVPTRSRKPRKISKVEKEPETTALHKKNTKKATKETATVEKQLQTEQNEPTETEQIEAFIGKKRQRDQPDAEKTNKEEKPKNKRTRSENTKAAEQTKSAKTAEATEEQLETNKRSSKRARVPNTQQSLRRASLEKLYAKEMKENKKANPLKRKKLPKAKIDTNESNETPIDVPPQVDELPDIRMDDEPVMPIHKNLFGHKIAIYSPSSRKNFKTDADSNVIIPEALIKSKLMKLSNVPDEWMKKFNGKKEYKMNASHRLRLLVPDTSCQNVDLTTNAKGGGDILARIGKLREPILIHERE